MKQFVQPVVAKECPRDCLSGEFMMKETRNADDLFNNHINPKYPDVTIEIPV